MPTYTYECSECSFRFDVFHSMSDNGKRTCPKCGAVAKHVIRGGVGVIFKGSGFYETDYKAKNSSFNGNGKGHGHNGHGQESQEEHSVSHAAEPGGKRESEKKT